MKALIGRSASNITNRFQPIMVEIIGRKVYPPNDEASLKIFKDLIGERVTVIIDEGIYHERDVFLYFHEPTNTVRLVGVEFFSCPDEEVTEYLKNPILNINHIIEISKI